MYISGITRDSQSIISPNVNCAFISLDNSTITSYGLRTGVLNRLTNDGSYLVISLPITLQIQVKL